LRFPEFKGEWEVKKLGENCNILMCKRIFASQTTEKGDVPFYKIGTIGNTADAYISKKIFEEYKNKYNYPHKGEILVTCAGTVGKCLIFDGKDAYFQDSNIVWIDNPNKKVINDFLYYFISRVNWSKLNSTTITRIYNDNLRDLEIQFPLTEEQKKITEFLALLDERILTQNKIIGQYKSLIKGITHYILKGKKANVRLKDCVTCHSSALTESEFEGSDGIYPVFGAMGIIAYTSQYNVDGDSILVIKDGASVGRVQYAAGKYSVIGTLNYLTTKKNFSLKYIYYYLRCFNFDKFKVGSGIPHIYFKDYGNELIYCPSFKEQNKITQAISSIEKKLNLEQIALKTYTTQKIYLLQNLFI
jgi:type I restriction enzyme S subunit